ncbi:hypothetical protein FJY63_05125, partial [Candidatus Sumerlaeota bacterium]|nr:hypothetical protein [Candidatus Sumerlaeota bacterium]
YQTGGGKKDGWRRYRSSEAGCVDFGAVYDKEAMLVAYALTCVQAKKPTQTVLRLGGSGAMKVFLNGQHVYQRSGEQMAEPDSDRVPVSLREGWNELMVKVVHVPGPWSASRLWKLYVSMDEPLVWSPDRREAPR